MWNLGTRDVQRVEGSRLNTAACGIQDGECRLFYHIAWYVAGTVVYSTDNNNLQ